jgi:hypothetical protein
LLVGVEQSQAFALALIDVPTATVRHISSFGPAPYGSIFWSPDSRWAFTNSLVAYRVETGEMTTLGDFEPIASLPAR